MHVASIVVAMLVLLTGCARARVSAPATGPAAPDLAVLGTVWTVERIEELVASRGATTVRFEEGRVSGRAGCNQYSGYLQAAGAALRISEVRSTRMACAPAVMQQEARFLTALGAVRRGQRDGERLLLLDETGHVRLVLGPPAPETGRRARVYECPDGPALAITETDGGDAIEAWLAEGRLRLPRASAAPGAPYTDGRVSIWPGEATVRLERDGRAWQCTERAAPR